MPTEPLSVVGGFLAFLGLCTLLGYAKPLYVRLTASGGSRD